MTAAAFKDSLNAIVHTVPDTRLNPGQSWKVLSFLDCVLASAKRLCQTHGLMQDVLEQTDHGGTQL